jgi:hypothetical protein
MDKTICKVIDLAEQHAETYRYWRRRSSSECFEATYRHSVDLYRQKGIVSNGEGSTRSCAYSTKETLSISLCEDMQSPTLLNRASQKIWIFFIDTSDEKAAIVYAALAAFQPDNHPGNCSKHPESSRAIGNQ